MKSNLVDPTDKTVTVGTLMARQRTWTMPRFGKGPEIQALRNVLGATDRLTSISTSSCKSYLCNLWINCGNMNSTCLQMNVLKNHRFSWDGERPEENFYQELVNIPSVQITGLALDCFTEEVCKRLIQFIMPGFTHEITTLQAAGCFNSLDLWSPVRVQWLPGHALGLKSN